MDTIIIRGQFPILPGQQEQCKAAALQLRERVLREDEGVTLYEFFMDKEGNTLSIIEVYDDEPSLIAHTDASDFSALFGSLDFTAGTIRTHGNISNAFQEKLGQFGPSFQHYLPLSA